MLSLKTRMQKHRGHRLAPSLSPLILPHAAVRGRIQKGPKLAPWPTKGPSQLWAILPLYSRCVFSRPQNIAVKSARFKNGPTNGPHFYLTIHHEMSPMNNLKGSIYIYTKSINFTLWMSNNFHRIQLR